MNTNFEGTEAVLLLADGKYFRGKSIGKIGTAAGEICFNTGMTGYQEIFTDPSYFGQIMVMNTVHIGNYGIHKNESESKSVKIAGLVCREFSDIASRTQSEENLQEYFLRNNICGIAEIDTRALVRHIRNSGAMNAILSSENKTLEELSTELKKIPTMSGLELSSKVSTPTVFMVGNKNASLKVALIDYGVKENIIRCLVNRGCLVTVFPKNVKAEEVISLNPDGIMLSNGPGDPSVMKKETEEIVKLFSSGLPVFGICLGHQLIAEAAGLKTFKMHHGHRGINHPVLNNLTGKCEVSSQNHGFAVDGNMVNSYPNIEVTHINLNDGTIEGLRLKNVNARSVQHHPEASPGPHDSEYFFDEFVEEISRGK